MKHMYAHLSHYRHMYAHLSHYGLVYARALGSCMPSVTRGIRRLMALVKIRRPIDSLVEPTGWFDPSRVGQDRLWN